MKFTKIPEETFQQMQLNAGILLYKFDPENVPSDKELYENLLCATSGGLNVVVTPTFSDLGEDIDNCPKNTKELKHLDSWEVTASGTAVTMDPDFVTFCLAAADLDESGHIKLRNDLDADKDFQDLWWVGDYNQGDGYVAVELHNALSTEGFSIQTNDQEKATADFTFTGHYSIDAQDDVPIDFYISENGAESDGSGNDDNDGDNGGDTEPDDEEP